MPYKIGYVTRYFTEIAHNLKVTSDYGPRDFDGFHRGIDFGGSGCRGTPLTSPWYGTVTHAGYDSAAKGYGHYIGITLESGHVMVFAHLDERLVSKGDTIAEGK